MTAWLRRVVVVAVLMAAATAVLDWWAVPLIGVAWGLVALPRSRPGIVAALGGGLGWALLLTWTGLQGSVPGVATRVGSILTIGGWALVGATLLFPALLGGTAAVLGSAARRGVIGGP